MASKKAKGGKRAVVKKRAAAKASSPARKLPAKKAPGKKGPAKKAPAKKVSAKKTPAKKAPASAKKAARKVTRVVKKVARTARQTAAKVVKKARSGVRPAAKKITPQKDGRPSNWPALSPYMTVRDAAASLAFYEAAFGFKVEGEVMRDGSGQIMHVGMRLNDACIMFAPQGMDTQMRAPADSGGIGLSLYVYVPDVNTHTARALRAGADIRQAPRDEFWGDRVAIFVDPDGYHWSFATHIGGFDASKAPR